MAFFHSPENFPDKTLHLTTSCRPVIELSLCSLKSFDVTSSSPHDFPIQTADLKTLKTLLGALLKVGFLIESCHTIDVAVERLA